MEQRRLEGSRVLLTGASSGVGLAATRLLAAEGARLALVSRRAGALGEQLREEGIEAISIAADLGEPGAGERAVEEAAAALGGLDVVVSNAAASVFGHFSEVHREDFDRTVDVTFRGAVDVIRAALPYLRSSRGVIVATGSVNSRVPLPTWSAYASAKHALRGFLNTLMVEEREQRSGVRVAMVHPGPIDTPLFAQASSSSGTMPRVPPDAYRPELVARALVEMAIDPRDELVLGGETRLIDVLYVLARPAAERVLLLVDRWYRSGGEASPSPGSLWKAPALPQLGGGIPSRDSLFAPVQLGRRFAPDVRTPFRLVRHLAGAGARAVELAGTLARPLSEQAPPARPLREAAGRHVSPGRRSVTV